MVDKQLSSRCCCLFVEEDESDHGSLSESESEKEEEEEEDRKKGQTMESSDEVSKQVIYTIVI